MERKRRLTGQKAPHVHSTFTEEDEEPHAGDSLQKVAAQHVERIEKVEDELGGGSADDQRV